MMNFEKNFFIPLRQIKHKCFNKFFIGNCSLQNCQLNHEDFNSEQELEAFCLFYKNEIKDGMSKPKKLDKLLQKFILDNLSTILDSQAPNPQPSKPQIEDNLDTESSEIEIKKDFASYYLHIYSDSKKYVDNVVNSNNLKKKT